MASTTLSFVYADRVAWLDDLHGSADPANHDLCPGHADRTGVPRGWELRDRRVFPPLTGLRPAG